MQMRNAVNVVVILLVMVGAAGCGKSEPPPQATTGQDSHPVKNVESLPSGTIQEGARTMNRAADLGKSLEQQKQDRDKEAEAQNK
jgi:predicted small lipoprotein YifL